MSFTKQLTRLAALASLLIAVPVIAQQVSTDYNHSTNFSQIHTYCWAKVKTSNPLNEDRVKRAVDQDLAAKGWQMVPSGGDVSLTAVGATRNQQEYNSFYDGFGGGGFGWRRGWGGGGFGDTTTTVQQIPVGTLVLDMYDTNSKQLVWRGMASDTLSSKPEKNTQKLDKAVKKMLDKFPPKQGAE